MGDVMRVVLVGLCLSVSLLSAGMAADDMMANYYGNTILSAGPAGQSHSYYRADHTFETKLGNLDLKGTWSIDAKGQLCRLYDAGAPPGIPRPLCTPWSAHKLGDNWIVTLGRSTRQMTLVAGIR
jgi:hypothetical protein